MQEHKADGSGGASDGDGRKMGRKNKLTKEVVGSANGSAVSDEEFAAAGMGLQQVPAAAAEGSGGKSMVPDDAGSPAHSMLDGAVPQPDMVDPSSGGGADGESEPAAAVLTLEQRGAAIRAGFKEHTRGKKWLAEGDAAQPAAEVPRAGLCQQEQADRRGQV